MATSGPATIRWYAAPLEVLLEGPASSAIHSVPPSGVTCTLRATDRLLAGGHVRKPNHPRFGPASIY